MCQLLTDNVGRTMEHAIVKEEKIPLEQVINLDQVCQGEKNGKNLVFMLCIGTLSLVQNIYMYILAYNPEYYMFIRTSLNTLPVIVC